MVPAGNCTANTGSEIDDMGLGIADTGLEVAYMLLEIADTVKEIAPLTHRCWKLHLTIQLPACVLGVQNNTGLTGHLSTKHFSIMSRDLFYCCGLCPRSPCTSITGTDHPVMTFVCGAYLFSVPTTRNPMHSLNKPAVDCLLLQEGALCRPKMEDRQEPSPLCTEGLVSDRCVHAPCHAYRCYCKLSESCGA